MTDFVLDARLQADSCLLGFFSLSQLRLINNGLFPWFILVPQVEQYEIHQLTQEQQIQLLDEMTAVSRFVEADYQTDKINVAAIGNIVRQLHVHIVGRYETDACWPGVVWGVKETRSYSQQEIEVIKDKLKKYFQADLASRYQSI